MGMGVHGVVPTAPAPIPIGDRSTPGPEHAPQPAPTTPMPDESAPKVGFVRGLLENRSDGWPIPRRRFEFSVVLIGEFGSILLIAPIYLIFGRLQGIKHTPGFQALCSLGAHMLQSTVITATRGVSDCVARISCASHRAASDEAQAVLRQMI